jgi:hypothetical protein
MKRTTLALWVSVCLTLSYIGMVVILSVLLGNGGLFPEDCKLVASILLGGLATHASTAASFLFTQASALTGKTARMHSLFALLLLILFALGIPLAVLAKAYRFGGWRTNREDFALVLGLIQGLYNAYVPLIIRFIRKKD